MFTTESLNKSIYRLGEQISIIKSLHKSKAGVASTHPTPFSNVSGGSLKDTNV